MKNQYVLVIPTASMEIGDTYPAGTHLPLQCTVTYWFAFQQERSFDIFTKLMEELSPKEFTGMELISDAPALFGAKNNIHPLIRSCTMTRSFDCIQSCIAYCTNQAEFW